MVSDQELIKKIKETFGKEAYQDDGSLNRPYLAKEAFEKGRVDELNGIVHPQLRKRIRELADKKEQEGVEVFAYEAAILLNEGRPEGLDYVVLLLAEDDTRVSRAAKRDQVDEQFILDRLEKQPNFEELSPLCDFLVMNDGSLKELQDKAKELYRFVNQIG